MTRLFRFRISEDSSTPQSCDIQRINSAREMTSVRTCYCKHERNVPNDVGVPQEKRYPATVASTKSVINNEACRSSEESKKMRNESVINEKVILNTDNLLNNI